MPGLPLAAADLLMRTREAAPILDIARLALAAGETVALTGPSGCGKTSLLNALAGLSRATRGSVRWGGTDLAELSGAARDSWRRASVGIVFQDVHLLPELDVSANILLPLSFSGWRMTPAARARAGELAAMVGLPEPRRRAGLLSRGEQQRAAIARALLCEPAVILADEPTASLDRRNADALGGLLADTAGRIGATLIVATHDEALIRRIGRVWRMQDGRMAHDRHASDAAA